MPKRLKGVAVLVLVLLGTSTEAKAQVVLVDAYVFKIASEWAYAANARTICEYLDYATVGQGFCTWWPEEDILWGYVYASIDAFSIGVWRNQLRILEETAGECFQNAGTNCDTEIGYWGGRDSLYAESSGSCVEIMSNCEEGCAGTWCPAAPFGIEEVYLEFPVGAPGAMTPAKPGAAELDPMHAEARRSLRQVLLATREGQALAEVETRPLLAVEHDARRHLATGVEAVVALVSGMTCSLEDAPAYGSQSAPISRLLTH